MESGYNTGDEWVHDEIFHEINFEEFAGNYYSELDSDFSENEEEPMDQGEALPAHGMQNIQNDMGEDELQSEKICKHPLPIFSMQTGMTALFLYKHY